MRGGLHDSIRMAIIEELIKEAETIRQNNDSEDSDLFPPLDAEACIKDLKDTMYQQRHYNRGDIVTQIPGEPVYKNLPNGQPCLVMDRMQVPRDTDEGLEDIYLAIPVRSKKPGRIIDWVVGCFQSTWFVPYHPIGALLPESIEPEPAPVAAQPKAE